jgi:hypothetical protein
MSDSMMSGAGSEQRLDGNAAAGLLREIFAIEMTSAVGTCAHCGKVGVLGESILYGGEIGTVLCCPGCEQILVCITHTPAGYWLDFRGLQVLRVVPAS